MFYSIALLGFAFLLFPMHCFGEQNIKESIVIIIDPGHGGTDVGAVGMDGIQEKDVVLKVAKEIERLNKDLLRNKFEVYLTRYSDTLISLGNRTELARKLKPDLFISLHCNHSENSNAKGVEVYVFNKKSETTKESVLLAYTIQKSIRQNLSFKSRGVKFANFQVLRETKNYFPSVLVELGFLSNIDEREYFYKSSNIEVIALTILMGIDEDLKSKL